MGIKYIVAHRKDLNNVGDIASNPLQYFLKPDEYKTIDVADLGATSYPENLPLIVGGGGLINNDFIGNDFFSRLLGSSDRIQLEEMWERSWNLSNPEYKDIYDNFHSRYKSLISEALEQVKPTKAPRFIWGIGQNSSAVSDVKYSELKMPKPILKYKLAGMRDYALDSKFDWVPCASCMHPALKKQYAIKNDIIWFEHKKQLIKDFGTDPIPRFVNSGDNIEQTIELLGSANIILTNSYHGAYWGTLMKKRVVVVTPWSSKFKFMKHTPVLTEKKEDWKDAISRAKVYPNALEECINANTEFWNKIKSHS